MAGAVRTRLLDATEELLREEGPGALTTRAIASRAACAEGSIYKNFGSRLDLLVALIDERFPDFSETLAQLPLRVGQATVEQILAEVIQPTITFYRRAAPLFAALIAERDVREGVRSTVKSFEAGPARWRQPLEAYLRAEQRMNRVGPEADIAEVVSMLLARCFQHALASVLFGDGSARGDVTVARTSAAVLAEALSSRPLVARAVPHQ